MIYVRILIIAAGFLMVGIQLVNQGREIQQLKEACIPANTGGGVVQCLQPNARQTGSVAR